MTEAQAMNSNKSTILLTPMHACEKKKEWVTSRMWQGLKWQAKGFNCHWRNKLRHSIWVFFFEKKTVGAWYSKVTGSFSLHEKKCWTCGDHDGFSLHV